MKRFKKEKIDPKLMEKLTTDANATVSRSTIVVGIFCCVILVVQEFANRYNGNWFRHVWLNCLIVILAMSVPPVLRKLKVKESIIMHTFAIAYMVVISVIFISLEGNTYGGMTMWADLLIMVFISMSYFSSITFWVYSVVFCLFWITVFTVRNPFLWTYIDMSDHIGRYGIFIILAGIAFWANRMIRQKMLENYEQIQIIEQYTKELEEKNRELQRLDQLKNEFLANTTHELKTPLHSIIGLLEPLLESPHEPLKADEQYDIALAVSSAKRLSALVEEILDFSSLRNQEVTLKKQYVDICVLTEMVCSSFEHQTKKKGIQLINAISPETELIYVDENRMLQIMFNLIGNAVKFTENGEIRISATKADRQMQISVSDTGIGIAPERQSQIFSSFVQADTSIAREYGGTGLGLAISKSLVELHGGTLKVESNLGEGSRFIVSIPLLKGEGLSQLHSTKSSLENWSDQAEQAYIESKHAGPSIKSAQTMEAEAPKILVVDDEPVNVRIVSNMLSKEGYRLTLAYGGKEALDLIAKGESYDLILLDVMMPQVSGFEVCAKIRETYTLAQLPILLLTAKSLTDDMVAGFNVGANDYLQKPFSMKELVARVKTLLALKRTTEKALSAELYFLQSQIKPHFLYNTLNTVNAYIRTNPELAREMILELSGYLQENFNFSAIEKTMPISKEISIIKSYLFIEKARFGDKLNVEYDIDESIRCGIPHLMLQPIVENAVRHGILEKQGGGTVKISVKRDGRDVVLCVEDDGVGMKADRISKLLNHEIEGAGIGVYNVHQRMLAIYGHGIEMKSQPDVGTSVRMRIPEKEV